MSGGPSTASARGLQQTSLDSFYSATQPVLTEDEYNVTSDPAANNKKKKKTSSSNSLDDMVVLDCIIERKTAADLASSIRDGRYREQKKRLMQCNVRVQSYIVEGLSLSTSARAGYGRGVSTGDLENAMVSIQVTSGIDVHRTRGLDHTIALLVSFHRYYI